MNPKGLQSVEIDLFAEFLRLTRYRYQYLFEYLGVAWSSLPTAERIDCRREGAYWHDNLTGKFVNKLYAPSSFFRKLKDRDQGVHLKCFDRESVPAGTVAAHRIRVEWEDPESEAVSGEILLLAERHSGLLLAKAFKNRISLPSFGTAYRQFSQMVPYEIKTLTFVSSRLESKPNSGKWERYATLFRLSADKNTLDKIGPRPISQNTLSELEDYIDPPAEVFLDPETPAQRDIIDLPGQYVNRTALSSVLVKVCNLVNLTQRIAPLRGRLVKISPLERIQKDLRNMGSPKTPKQLRRKLQLPRKFRGKAAKEKPLPDTP